MILGQKIVNDPSIDRLIEIRTVLEKIRPIDYKLRYQIDKLVKTAVTGSENNSDLTSFKANPSNLMSKVKINSSESEIEDDTDDEDGGDGGKAAKSKSKSNIYVPPKLTSVHYDGDETKQERTQKLMDRAKKRALNSSIIQDLKEEYLDTPLEITTDTRAQKQHSRSMKEKEEYEEKYLTRMPVTKQEKHRNRKLTTMGTLGSEMTNFADISALEDGGGGGMPSKRKRTGGATSSSKKKKKGSKKRKFH